MGCCGTGTGGRDQDLEIDTRLDFEKIDPLIQREIFCIIPREVRRLSAVCMNAMDPSVWTERWLHLDLTIVALTAVHTPAP
jgi:hypothetical protein